MNHRAIMLVCWWGWACALQAATWYVATTGDDGANSGTGGWDQAYATISNAVAHANTNAGDAVWVSNGIYTLTVTNIIVTNAITVRSWNDGALDAAGTVVDGNLVTRCFRLAHSSAVVDSLTIRNGTNAVGGGGVFIDRGGQLWNCIVASNYAPDGAGIYVNTGGLVAACTVQDNLAFTNQSMAPANAPSHGGGIFMFRGGVVSNCVISGNTVSNKASQAGTYNYSGGSGIGIYIANAADRCRVYSSVISNNYSYHDGGGIMGFQGFSGVDQIVVQDCTNVNNTAERHGGGMIVHGGVGVAGMVTGGVVMANTASISVGYAGGVGGYLNGTAVYNCLVQGNKAYRGGGTCKALVYNSTIESNTAYGEGGGVYVDTITSPVGNIVSNCVIRGNRLESASSYGGGVAMSSAGGFMGVVTDCQIYDNFALDSGGGLSFRISNWGPMTGLVQNCLIYGNVASNGAGLNLRGTGVTVSACTIVSNRAFTRGGGVHLALGYLTNCIIYSNDCTTASWKDLYTSSAGVTNNLGYCCISTNIESGKNNITNEPVFVDFAAQNYRLAAGSPGINMGYNMDWMPAATDLDGTNARIQQGRADMGAYEYGDGGLSCVFAVSPVAGLAPLTNVFSASVSGTNQDALYYLWDFNADGTPERQGADLAVVTNVYTDAGYYQAALTVTNAVGEVARYTNNFCAIKAGPLVYYVAAEGPHIFPYTNWATAGSNNLPDVLPLTDTGDSVVVSNGLLTLNRVAILSRGVTVRSLNGWDQTVVSGNGATHCFYVHHSNAVIAGLTISNGFATSADPNYSTYAVTNGGGVTLYRGGTVSNCVIRNCRANIYGGGALLWQGGALRNCLIVTNITVTNGGGVYIFQTGQVENCTIAGNVAGNFGGGLRCSNTGARVVNCIIYSNFTGSGQALNWYTNGGAVTFTNCCVMPTNDLQGAGNVADEPGWIDFGGGDFRLGAGSPGIDGGANQDWMTTAAITDLGGSIPRIRNGTVDIGAYEYDFYGPTNVAASDGTYADKIEIAWETVSQAQGYSIWRSQTNTTNTAACLGAAEASPYADITASTGVLYYYWVQATNALAPTNSLFGVSDSGYIQDPAAPAPPSNVAASVAAWTDRIEITWSTNNDAAGYAVWRHATNDAAFAVQLGRVEDVTVGVYTDAAVPAAGTFYYYWVTASNASLSSVFSAPAAPGVQALMPATNVIASKGLYTNQVTVIWQTNQCTNAAGYLVWRNAGSDDLSAAQLVGGTAGTNYTDTGVATNVQYFYWVEPTNAASASTNSCSVPDWGYCALTYYVATNGTDTNAGVDWATALATISNGAAKAHRWAGGDVIVSNGTYNLTVQLTLSNAVWVRSFSGETNTVIDGGGTNRCVYITNAILDGFTVTNAGLVDTGGGVYIRYTGQVWNCTLTGNRASYQGGGIYFYGGGVATNCRIVGNVVTGTPGTAIDANGGGAYCNGGGLLTNCAISFNVATNTNPSRQAYGGGVYCSSAAGTVINCLVYTNAATYSGGGIYGGTVLNSLIVSNQGVIARNNNHGGGGCASCTIVSNCTIIWNSCANGSYGSGGAASGCTVVKNCTNISFNSARRPGGVEVTGAGKYLLDSVVFSNRGGDAAGGVQLTYGGVVSGCVIYGNSVVGPGGGVYCYNWTAGAGPVIQDCLISNNVSSNGGGGGIYFTGYGMYITGAVQRCTIVSNRALGASFQYGGGIYANTESILVQDCTISGNYAAGYGGGLYHVNNTGTVERCVVQNNQSSWSGGGGYLSYGVTVRNCLFMNNATINAGQAGGGIYLDRIGNSNGYLSACTIVSNRSGYGGGLCLANTNNLVVDCVIVSNAATTLGPDLYATTAEQSNSFWNCCVPTNLPAAQGNLEARPPFLDPAAGNWRLAAGSPCINQGLYQDWMAGAIDKDGNLRILGGTVDMGAYEYPLYLQANPLGITNTLVTGIGTGTLVEVWSGDTNAELTYAASSTNEWISLGVSNGVIAVNTTNALWVTNDSTGLAAGIYTGTVLVVATNSLSALYPPDTQTVTVIMTVRRLEAPANVQATDGAYADKVVVTWDTNLCTNATGYAVWRSLAADTNSASILSAASDTSYADTSAANGVLYYYWVQATNAGSFSDLSESNTGYRALAPPTGVTASDGTYSGKVVVTWQTNMCTNAAGYSVWRNTANDIASATRLVGAAGTNYDDTSAASNILYYYWVQATNTLSQTNTSAGGPDTGYWALTYYVATNGSDANPGLDWTAPAASISNAVVRLQRCTCDGGMVFVSNGTYALTAQVSVTSNITVRSWHDGELDRTNTIVDGQRLCRGFYLNRSGALVAGFTITNGSNTCGGGVYIVGGTVSNCIITDNLVTGGSHYTAGGGGGVLMDGSAAAVRNCVIQRNTSAQGASINSGGAGVFLNGGGLLKDCDVIGNNDTVSSWGGGGGLYVRSGGTLDHCRVISNTAAGSYGGLYLYNYGGAILLTNCTVAGNTAAASHGGLAVASDVKGIIITDCVISNNTATGAGDCNAGGLRVGSYCLVRKCQIVNNRSTGSTVGPGALVCSGSATVTACVVQGNYPHGVSGYYDTASAWRLVNCLISGNTNSGVEFLGGLPGLINCTIVNNKRGVAVVSWTPSSATGQVVNTIVYSNTIVNYAVPSGSQYYFTNSCTKPLPALGAGNFTDDPAFVNTNAANYRLQPGSPCINAGTNDVWMDTALDLGDRPRIRYGRVDVGCYEYYLNVKVDGVPLDRILRINGVDQNRIFKINQ